MTNKKFANYTRSKAFSIDLSINMITELFYVDEIEKLEKLNSLGAVKPYDVHGYYSYSIGNSIVLRRCLQKRGLISTWEITEAGKVVLKLLEIAGYSYIRKMIHDTTEKFTTLKHIAKHRILGTKKHGLWIQVPLTYYPKGYYYSAEIKEFDLKTTGANPCFVLNELVNQIKLKIQTDHQLFLYIKNFKILRKSIPKEIEV